MTRAAQRARNHPERESPMGLPEPAVQLIQSSLHEVGIEVKLSYPGAGRPVTRTTIVCATPLPRHVPPVESTPDVCFRAFPFLDGRGNFTWSC